MIFNVKNIFRAQFASKMYFYKFTCKDIDDKFENINKIALNAERINSRLYWAQNSDTITEQLLRSIAFAFFLYPIEISIHSNLQLLMTIKTSIPKMSIFLIKTLT